MLRLALDIIVAIIRPTYVVKLPEKSIAPPTNAKSGKEMPPRAELLAIWHAPPVDFNRGIEMLASLELATNAKLPSREPVLPTLVKFGALMDVKKFS